MKKAFTLAEVLITLAIIGIVAAMTIPTLVKNYQTTVWNTSAKIFEKKLEEALKIMNTEQTLAGHKTTEKFVSELQKHIKISNICKNHELEKCFEKEINGLTEVIDIATDTATTAADKTKISNLSTAKQLGQENWSTNTVGIQFANGTTAILAYNDYDCRQNPYSNQVDTMNCLAIIYDTTGFKKPNEYTKDIRSSANVKLSGTCAFKINGTCFTKPFKPNPINCPALSNAEKNEIYNKYNIENSCFVNSDWLGHVISCGGKDKMPTEEQLKQLADYLYDQNGFNNTKAQKLGFDVNLSEEDDYFYIWTGEEWNYPGCCLGQVAYWYTKEKATVAEYGYGDYAQAICITP